MEALRPHSRRCSAHPPPPPAPHTSGHPRQVPRGGGLQRRSAPAPSQEVRSVSQVLESTAPLASPRSDESAGSVLSGTTKGVRRPPLLPDHTEEPPSPAISVACASEGRSGSRPHFPRPSSVSPAAIAMWALVHARGPRPGLSAQQGHMAGKLPVRTQRQTGTLPFKAGNKASEK